MAIELAIKFSPYVDEQFTKESKKEVLTNKDFDWDGAKAIKIYKVTTASMNDYDRDGTGANASRYGVVQGLDATTQTMPLTKDRSFTFAIDKMDEEETVGQLKAATALARQIREVIIPEIDTWLYSVMASNAGTTPVAKALTSDNIYTEILNAGQALDNAFVPETDRYLLVTPAIYLLMKQSKEITMETNIGSEMRIRGVIAMIDGASVIKIPANRLPAKFGFMMIHPSATAAPTKLQDYKIHQDPPGISGSLVEGRIVYDAFVLDNKTKAIYLQKTT